MTIDFSNLREFTDGDVELELGLFEEFIHASSRFIDILRDLVHEGDIEIWRKEAHGLKGIALNLGAGDLGELARQAQEFSGSTPEKQDLFRRIEAEHKKVLSALHEEIVRISQ